MLTTTLTGALPPTTREFPDHRLNLTDEDTRYVLAAYPSGVLR
ncbi:hypothetical protein [Streptomyces zingiberis]|nr:hypothetical protein [Streptomyces zingiberis]